MARSLAGHRWWLRRTGLAWLAAAAALSAAGMTTSSASGSVASSGPTSAGWCSSHGAAVRTWAPTTPALPICGPGPAYGGSWEMVSIPGPYGATNQYYNATPGFQCVELSDRFLAVADGFGAVMANGSEVVMNYHAAYPNTTVVVNGTRGAVGHPPTAGDVLSFSTTPSFYDPTDGHTAVVVASRVNAAGNGRIEIAQENVSAADYLYDLRLVAWRLVDPKEPPNAEFQYPYAEWLIVPSSRVTGTTVPSLLTPAISSGASSNRVRSVVAATTRHLRRKTAK